MRQRSCNLHFTRLHRSVSNPHSDLFFLPDKKWKVLFKPFLRVETVVNMLEATLDPRGHHMTVVFTPEAALVYFISSWIHCLLLPALNLSITSEPGRAFLRALDSDVRGRRPSRVCSRSTSQKYSVVNVLVGATNH